MVTKYQMLSVIGRGSYGTVWLAQDTASNKKVAIKAIKRHTLLSSESRKQLKREIAALASVKHHNVVAFRECYEDNSNVYIVTEVCGQELYDHIVDQGFLSEKQTKLICHQILLAVQHLHAKGMVHRDIKPENFCLCGSEKNIVKLIDFGLCCVHNDETMHKRCGSYFYVAPEVLAKNYKGGTCDVWSVGVVLFVMLVGYPPFYGETDAEIADQVKHADPDLTQKRWKNISEDAKDLVLRMLNKSPKQRINITEALNHPWLREVCEARAQVRLPVPSLLECTKRRRSKSLELISRSGPDDCVQNLHMHAKGMVQGDGEGSCAHSQTCDDDEIQTLQGHLRDFRLCADPANAPSTSLSMTPEIPKQPRRPKRIIFGRSFRRRANLIAAAPP